jgi:hypothetical protein
MKRKTFLVIASVVALLFAVIMIAAPGKVMQSQGLTADEPVKATLQFLGVMILAVAIITYLSRNDPGSIALRAVLIGSIVVHVLSMAMDWITYARGVFSQVSGIIPGTVVHTLLAIGFIYYLVKLPGQK